MRNVRKTGWLALCAAPLLMAATLSGDTDDNGDGTSLSVSGQGFSSQSAEILTISAGASSFSKHPSRAVRDNAAKLNRLRKELSDANIAPRDITTGRYNFARGRDPDDDDGRSDKGYIAEQQLVVFVRDSDQAGAVLDALVEVGADDLSINNRFGVYGTELSEDVRADARKAAVADARSKGEDYAAALGMRIKRVISVQDRGVHMSGAPAPAVRTVTADMGTQIDNGERAVVASVAINFELEPLRRTVR